MKTKQFVKLPWSAFLVGLFIASSCALIHHQRCQAAPARTLEEQEKEIDKKQLRQIYEAIQAYRKKRGDLPTWLSELVPDFLPDPEVLVSPVEKRTGQSRIWEYPDPKLKVSYVYEFSGNRAGGQVNQNRQTPLTMKEWKTLQMDEFGPATPLLRCHLYDPVLNLSFSGEFYETGLFWESDPNTIEMVKKLGSGPGEKSTRNLIVKVVDDETGQPLANVEVSASNRRSERGPLPPRSARTDAQGKCRMPLGGEDIQSLSLNFRREGYANAPVQWEGSQVVNLPEAFTARLKHALPVGGFVRTRAGQPVADAKVVVSAVARDEAGQFALSEYETVASDASGKWSSRSLPKDFKSLSLEVSHPSFMPAEFEQAASDDPADKKFSRESLLAGKAVLVLEPGIAVEGTVADSTGKPVADAEVTFTDLSNPPKKQLTRTDAKGAFSFVSIQAGEFHLIVQAKGFAPSDRAVEIERDLKPVSFMLNKGNTLKGRVVDDKGKPIEGVAVALQSWNELQSLNWSTTTDADGRFSWDSAPDGTANYSASKAGYDTVAFGADGSPEQTIKMTQVFRLTGKVVDADTSQPIRDFKIIRGYILPMAEGEQVNWEFHDEKPGSAGQYLMTRDERRGVVGEQVKFLVRAEGYLPTASPVFPPTGWHTFDFELKKGNGPSGVVVSPAGQPVAEAEVALLGAGYLNLAKGAFKQVGPRNAFVAKTDAGGRFSLAAAVPSPTLVAVHQQGYAEIAAEELAKAGKVVLQPWGRVEGILKNGTRPGTNEDIMITPKQAGPGGINYDFDTFKTRTDDAGRFTIDYVPPGPRQLVSIVPMGQGRLAGWMWSQFQPIDVKPGEPTQVVYGGAGRPVSGRLALSDPKRKVDWNSGQHSFGTKYPQPPRRFKTAEEWQEWNNSPEMKEARKNHRYYALRIAEDGSFRVENVLPGTYQLSIHLNEPGEDRFRPGPPIGNLTRDVTVADIPGGVTDDPLDLDVLTLQLKADLKVGDPAPGFEVKTLEGKPLKLSDYRGKFVLLDFWATWCGPCVAELPKMKETYEAFGKDPRFVIIGLSLDAEPKEVEEFVRTRGLKWIQGFLGEWSQTKLPDQFGVSGIPATLLIGPDGRIIAKDLRGGATRDAVAKALGQERKVSAN